MTDKIPSSWIYTKLENIVDIFDYERNPINNAERGGLRARGEHHRRARSEKARRPHRVAPFRRIR